MIMLNKNINGFVIPEIHLTGDRRLTKITDTVIDNVTTLFASWNRNDFELAELAISKNFTDLTHVEREKGITGVKHACRLMHAAMSDFTLKLERIIIMLPHVTVQLKGFGHFDGEYNGVKGHGQYVEYKAQDVFTVHPDTGIILNNTPMEDNYGMLKQMGASDIHRVWESLPAQVLSNGGSYDPVAARHPSE